MTATKKKTESFGEKWCSPPLKGYLSRRQRVSMKRSPFSKKKQKMLCYAVTFLEKQIRNGKLKLEGLQHLAEASA